MRIEVEVEHRKHDWSVEIFVSAEHRHDFVAQVERRPWSRPWTRVYTSSKISSGGTRTRFNTIATRLRKAARRRAHPDLPEPLALHDPKQRNPEKTAVRDF